MHRVERRKLFLREGVTVGKVALGAQMPALFSDSDTSWRPEPHLIFHSDASIKTVISTLRANQLSEHAPGEVINLYSVIRKLLYVV